MKWIKPDDLPEEFWDECFVGHKNEKGYHVDSAIKMVRKFDKVSKWYCESLQEWFSFRDDIDYRVMVIEYPKITGEDFK